MRFILGPTTGTRDDDAAADPPLVLAHVREQVAPVGVADGVQPALLGALGAQAVVDGDRLSGSNPPVCRPM
ncbi:MAG TPA: hypothetical protein VHI11_07225, partial [Jiangellaceae bacterium]|nr:hypothetical protein [Jiangellaceae bacterium]